MLIRKNFQRRFNLAYSIGVDFSSKMISRGQEQYPYLDLRVKDKGYYLYY
ncbi:hypothetical protein [uncultured Clostridium sp.]